MQRKMRPHKAVLKKEDMTLYGIVYVVKKLAESMLIQVSYNIHPVLER